MAQAQTQPHLDQAFERIEETILPCLSLMLQSLVDASAGVGETRPAALSAELRAVAAELEELTRAVERTSAVQRRAGESQIASG